MDSKEMGDNLYTCSLPKGDKRSLYAPVDRTSGGQPNIYQDISGIGLFTRSNLHLKAVNHLCRLMALTVVKAATPRRSFALPLSTRR